jgi:hypothetical protein
MKTLFLFVLVALSAQAFGLGLQTSVSADIVGTAGLHKDSNTTDDLRIRGAEVMFYAPADHLFDGVLSAAAHGEGGIPSFELHEAWIGSTKLIPRSRFRLGQFFLQVGRLNQFHQHDWPFISAPRVHREFFAPEGALDTGGEYSFLTPLPFYLELTVGITNGFIYGHDHTKGARPMVPTHYARAVTYTAMPFDGGAQIGFNYLGRRGNEGTQRTMFGIDFTSKWKAETVTQFLLQAEVWQRSLTPKGSLTQNQFGFYIYPEYYLGSDVFVGMRFDHYSVLNLKDATGDALKNFEWNFVPTITYKPSHFTTFRLAYNHKPEYLGDRFTRTTRFIEAQAIFILGAHPAHEF